jgi:predicted GNAT superfamily acetyltransferase
VKRTIDFEIASAPAADRSRVDIRPLTHLEELAACVEMQRAVWGWADIDIMPVRLFVLMQHAGGIALGAYREAAFVGFVNCVAGVREGRAFWHSHMLAVHPAYRDLGIGTALKLAQRDHARRHRVGWIEWVFDPLEAKNAYLNVAKLGAVIRRYSIDHYGASTSRLHAGLESDRVVAEWQVDAPRASVRGRETRTLPVPADVQALRRTDLGRARALQLAVREEFLLNLSQGFVVVGCERRREGVEYVFCREREPGDSRP